MTSLEKAKVLETAIRERRPVRQFSLDAPDFDVKAGYDVQWTGLELALGRGEKLAGYKMGLTSRAKQRDVNVFESIRGYLLASMEIAKGAPVDTSTRIHPRVEPEVAVILKSPLAGPGVTLRAVVAALDVVLPALEILDSRFEAFQFKLADVVADNTSASGFLLGRANLLPKLSELNLMGVSLRKNGQVHETGTPAAVLGDPLLSVVELANALGREGKRLEPGMVVLTGGITAAVPFAKGDAIDVVWPDETLSFRAT